MLAEIIAVIVVSLLVLGPLSLLLQLGWKQGGAMRLLTVAALLGMLSLALWLFLPGEPGVSQQDRIVQFVGAFGILCVLIGLAFAAVSLVGNRRRRDRADRDR
jgi:hypothetical protein